MEPAWGLRYWGTLGCDSSLNLASATEYHDVWDRMRGLEMSSESEADRLMRTHRTFGNALSTPVTRKA